MLLLVLKASALLAVTLLAVGLPRASAATRHTLWSCTFAALLALPLLTMALPALDVPVPAGFASSAVSAASAAAEGFANGPLTAAASGPSATRDDGAARLPADPRLSDRQLSDGQLSDGRLTNGRFTNRAYTPASAADMAMGLWAAGTLAALSALLLSLWRVRLLSRRAEPLDDAGWQYAIAPIAAALGLRKEPRVLVNRAVRTPMAGGVWCPLIFLPADARTWSAERRHVVLAHELSHLAVRDPLRHIAARLAIACYWFHPLAWLAARQASLAREQACDAAVIALGVRPSDYARVLLELAEGLAAAPRAAAALPMVQRSLLEKRLMAILDDGPTTAARRTPLPWIGIAAAITITVAAARPAAQLPIDTPLPVAPASALAIEPAVAPTVAATPAQADRDTACWSNTRGGNFRGYSNINSARMILEQIGTRGTDRVVQQTLGDLRICMVAEDAAALEDSDKPSQWRAPRIVIESNRGGQTSQLVLRRQAGGGEQASYRVNGAERAFDSAAQEWRAAMLAVLDTTWELAMLRGQVSTLHGEISTLRGEESTLRGEISTLMGEVSTMRGRQSTIWGEESTLRGEISTIRGHVSSLRGEISSERGSISSLNAARYDLSADDRRRIDQRIRDHEAAIDRLEREIDAYDAEAKIAAVEKQIRALDAPAKAAAIDTEIRNFDLDAKVAAIEKRIEALDVNGKTAAIDRQISGLDSQTRVRQLEDRRADESKRLDRALAAIR